jgi:hypothetical protein
VNAPPGEPGTQHWMIGAVVLVVVELLVVVVELVVELVVVVGVHAGSAGSVQEQSVVLQLSITAFLHARNAAPTRPAHPVAISSEQTLGLHGPTAVASETKPPVQSATANNVTTAFLVIVEPPCGRSDATIDFGALLPRVTAAT